MIGALAAAGVGRESLDDRAGLLAGDAPHGELRRRHRSHAAARSRALSAARALAPSEIELDSVQLFDESQEGLS